MRTTAHHVGVDEAGLGPNLGPLVIVATRWSGPPCHTDDLWKRFDRAVTQEADGVRLHVGDSKSVYRNKKDFATLERSARAILAAAGITEPGLAALIDQLDPNSRCEEVPWLDQVVDGPTEPPDRQLVEALIATETKLEVAAAIVPALRFNSLLDERDSKGQMLSRLSLETLRRVWGPTDEPTLVWCDKHGGRNRYDDLLLEHCDREFVIRHEEGREASRYEVGGSQIVFGVKSERYFPVACASLVAKYTRQRAMRAFNAWWAMHVPGLKPTEGYPLDARRFRSDVTEASTALGISNELLWRAR